MRRKDFISKLSVHRLPKDFELGILLVLKTLKLNKIDLDVNFSIDYGDEDLGYFDSNYPTTIFYNPKTMEKNIEYYGMNCYGFSEIGDIKSVFLHELGHLLDYHFDYKDHYKKRKFANQFHPNAYSVTSLDEEIAEMVRIYLSNPYFLRMIAPERYDFMKERLISPSPCTKNYFNKLYRTLSASVKFDLLQKFKLQIFD